MPHRGFSHLEKTTRPPELPALGRSECVPCRRESRLSRGKTVVRNVLVRNWLTGQCGLAGLPPGDDYSLALEANGWSTETIKPIKIMAGKTRWRQPVYMQRRAETVIHRFRFPRLNQQAIRRPGETFRARFLGFDAKIDSVRLVRTVGPAVISRKVEFQEDIAAKYYYDREVVATLPDDMPPGLYDLFVNVTGGRRTGSCRSPRSVTWSPRTRAIRSWSPSATWTLGPFPGPGVPGATGPGNLQPGRGRPGAFQQRLQSGLCPRVRSPASRSLTWSTSAITSSPVTKPGSGPGGTNRLRPANQRLNFGHPWHIGPKEPTGCSGSGKRRR
ncbi:MAG: hypothetical protein CM1200mP2_12480 [Planctomycetaceae bacterium]|nr:MAG: hypothetical protein CM1200mP2_12480 [Planctomycetaceae bacterium]